MPNLPIPGAPFSDMHFAGRMGNFLAGTRSREDVLDSRLRAIQDAPSQTDGMTAFFAERGSRKAAAYAAANRGKKSKPRSGDSTVNAWDVADQRARDNLSNSMGPQPGRMGKRRYSGGPYPGGR